MNVGIKFTSKGGLDGIQLKLKNVVKEAEDKYAGQLARDIKNRATALFGSGVYSDGWTWKREGDATIVYNSGKDRSLSHLLEYGHLVVDRNARIHGSWKPPAQHIEPAYNEIKDKFLEEIKKTKLN